MFNSVVSKASVNWVNSFLKVHSLSENMNGTLEWFEPIVQGKGPGLEGSQRPKLVKVH